MSCQICGEDSEGKTFCVECSELLERLYDQYDLKGLSKLFVYALGAKTVEDISQDMADRLFDAYTRHGLENTEFHCQQ